MILLEHATTFNWEGAIRGMRNPMNSWSKSDTTFNVYNNDQINVIIGEKDLDLMRRLRAGGSDDRKYLRQIGVCVDITAPLYWWKECDQYKVGTVTNSCSTMHKISAKKFTPDDFSHEHLNKYAEAVLETTIMVLNESRAEYIKTKSKDDWWQMIQLLPSSYNQKRTWTANYEVLVNIYKARKNHKLDEWHDFCRMIESLPYAKELIIGD